MKKGEKMSDELKVKIGNGNRGKKRSKEQIERIRQLRVGITLSEAAKRKISLRLMGNQYARKNGSRQYVTIHNRVREKYGSPTTCEHCLRQGLKSTQIHWANIDHKYRMPLRRTDWKRLCRGCHRRYDHKMGLL